MPRTCSRPLRANGVQGAIDDLDPLVQRGHLEQRVHGLRNAIEVGVRALPGAGGDTSLEPRLFWVQASVCLHGDEGARALVDVWETLYCSIFSYITCIYDNILNIHTKGFLVFDCTVSNLRRGMLSP